MSWRRKVWGIATLCCTALGLTLAWQYFGPRFSDFAPDEPLALIRDGDKCGFITQTGIMVIPPVWDSAQEFDDGGWAKVQLAGKWGWIDRSGRVVLPAVWDDAGTFDTEGRVRVKQDGKWGWLNRQGLVVIPPAFQSAKDFDARGRAMVFGAQGWARIDREGKPAPPVFQDWAEEELSDFYEVDWADGIDLLFTFFVLGWDDARDREALGWKRVQKNARWGWIDRQYRQVVPPVWDDVERFDSRGLARVNRDGKWGWIDRQNRLVIAPGWNAALDFESRDVALVRRDEKWGLIDRQGREIIPPTFDDVRKFDARGFAVVSRGRKKWGFIDREGRFIGEPVWDGIAPDGFGYMAWTHPHPLFRLGGAEGVAAALGMDDAPVFGRLMILYDHELHPYWRSDLYALRFLLLPSAAVLGLLALLCGWRWRRA